MTMPSDDLAAARELLRPVADVDALSDEAIRERRALLEWNAVAEPGDGVAGALIAAVGAHEALHVAHDRGLLRHEIEGIPADALRDALARWQPRLKAASAVEALRAAARVGARMLTAADAEWPPGATLLSAHAPLCLWVRGDASLLAQPTPAVAIVGARAATGYGEHVAMELAAALAADGTRIVSGAAYGIDGCAHRAALHVDGRTIAFLAGGVDRPYPAGHAELIGRIVAHGAVVSEVPCGTAPTKWRFLARNRTIAAVSDAVVVVEAGWRSGSLNTAAHASQLGIPLGAVPGPITSAASTGCHRLLREHDARCITGVDDVRELLGGAGAQHPSPDGAAAALTRVADALSRRVDLTPDEIAARAGMDPADVREALLTLQLSGVAEPAGNGWRRLTARR
ncbi:DNA-processing protein DprA [Microbacterium fluvii]|uniref:DNA-processing protein DprA n=1 Tax=Microbacterium fluvii TaxID=415215 RepID=A0ABW2HDL4_9MICO|nr:DNA-processing protein DprA [Microbacterium fluvii]MCU4672562.1 DNA-processing protein DprA [Microbacterium fluvii]